jgi:hypothetical protein
MPLGDRGVDKDIQRFFRGFWDHVQVNEEDEKLKRGFLDVAATLSAGVHRCCGKNSALRQLGVEI